MFMVKINGALDLIVLKGIGDGLKFDLDEKEGFILVVSHRIAVASHCIGLDLDS